MLALLERNCERAEKHRHRLFERHPMLPNVCARLLVVPIELSDANRGHRADTPRWLRSTSNASHRMIIAREETSHGTA